MSEATEVPEVTEEVNALPEGAFINISMTPENVKYDTNLTVPELIFWLRVVENMALNKVLTGQ
jgi:hypothetical protein